MARKGSQVLAAQIIFAQKSARYQCTIFASGNASPCVSIFLRFVCIARWKMGRCGPAKNSLQSEGAWANGSGFAELRIFRSGQGCRSDLAGTGRGRISLPSRPARRGCSPPHPGVFPFRTGKAPADSSATRARQCVRIRAPCDIVVTAIVPLDTRRRKAHG